MNTWLSSALFRVAPIGLALLGGTALLSYGCAAMLQSNGGTTALSNAALPAPFEDAVMLASATNDGGFAVVEGSYASIEVYRLAGWPDTLPDWTSDRNGRTYGTWRQTLTDRTGWTGLPCNQPFDDADCSFVDGIYWQGRDAPSWRRLPTALEADINTAWATEGNPYTMLSPYDFVLLIPDTNLAIRA